MHDTNNADAAHAFEDRPIRVLAMSGSQRRQSYNAALLRAARDLALPAMTIEIYDLAPHSDLQRRYSREHGYPLDRRASARQIRAADALLIASPEYNRSVPALLKNAIDWASRRPDQPFKDKPIAIMGVSNGALGAAFANYHLRQIFVYLDARVLNGPEVMIGNAKAKFDMAGRLADAADSHIRRRPSAQACKARDAGKRAYPLTAQ